MAGGVVANLVRDHKAKSLGVADFAAHFEEVGIDTHEAPITVAGGKGIDHAVAGEDVGVGYATHAELFGSFGDHPVSLGELRGAHAHAGGSKLRIHERAGDP